MGYRVAVLEQGRLWHPGDFPTTTKARRKALRISGRKVKLGDPAGLYCITAGNGISVLAATGVGGGSLINAGVTLRPNFERLRRLGWPEPVLNDGLFEKGLDRAEGMLGVMPAPEPERFGKFNGMCRAAQAMGVELQRPSMTIAHQARVNAAGVMQYGCRQCGDCWSGCNVGAKTTVGITYLTDAVDHGADVCCLCRVDTLNKVPQGKDQLWQVTVTDMASAGGERQRRIGASMLILAAGTLGTNQLLLRAKARGLALSPKLGQNFSANGDDLVFATGLDKPVHATAIGHPPQAPRDTPLIGPHSMALFNLGDEDTPIWIHDGTMMSVMAHIAPLKALLQLQFSRAWRLIKGGVYGDEQSRTLIFYIVSHDDAGGTLRLHNNHVYVDWPEFSASPSRVAAEQKAREMIKKLGGTFQSNPFALSAFGGNRIIAHPLGGCAMADDADHGVVAHDGRVFDPSQGKDAVHDGLYVCDGAAIPSAVGVSPLLTITALAERAMSHLAQRQDRTLDVDAVPAGRRDRDAAA